MKHTWELHHVGIPVRDLDKAIENYSSLGIASFQPEFMIDSSKFAEYLVYGKTPNPVVKTRVVLGQVGSMGIELLQPVQGETVHKEFLEGNGDGVGHIAYSVADLEGEMAELVATGCPIILSITPQAQIKPSAVYIDTRSRFSNLIVELIQQ